MHYIKFLLLNVFFITNSCENGSCIYDHPQLSRKEIEDIQAQQRVSVGGSFNQDRGQFPQKFDQNRRPLEPGINQNHHYIENQNEFYRDRDSGASRRIFDTTGKGIPSYYPDGIRGEQLLRGSISEHSQSFADGHKRGAEGADEGKNEALPAQTDSKAESIRVALGKNSDLREHDENGQWPGVNRKNDGQRVDESKLEKDVRSMRPGEPRTQALYNKALPGSGRDDYWESGRPRQEGQYTEERYGQLKSERGNEWSQTRDLHMNYAGAAFREEEYVSSEYPRMSHSMTRAPIREALDRGPIRGDPGRSSVEPDPLRAAERGLPSRDYPERALLREEPSRLGESNRPASPPRQESFREQLEFEKRYRDWERQHFPIDDPTREWEYELRRRELLGESLAPPNRTVSDGPTRNVHSYEREG